MEQIDRERERERETEGERKKERKREIKRENKKKVIDVRETIIEKWPLRGQRWKERWSVSLAAPAPCCIRHRRRSFEDNRWRIYRRKKKEIYLRARTHTHTHTHTYIYIYI